MTIPFLRVYHSADGTFRSDGYEHGAWKTAPVVGRPLTKEEFSKLVGAGFDVPFTGLIFGQTVLAKLPPGFTRGKFKTETGYVFYTVLGPIQLEKS